MLFRVAGRRLGICALETVEEQRLWTGRPEEAGAQDGGDGAG